MLVAGQVSPLASSASLSAGLQAALRMGNMGDAIVSELHGRYYEQAYRKTLFAGANQAAVATAFSAGVPTTYTGGLVLYNPPGNTWNAVLQKVAFAFVVAQTNAAIISLGVGFSATALAGTLTSVTPRSRNIGSGANPTCGLVSSASVTLPVAPTVDTVLGAVDTGALTTQTTGNLATIDLEGSILLPPGAFACFLSSAAGTASSFMGSMAWEEVPV